MAYFVSMKNVNNLIQVSNFDTMSFRKKLLVNDCNCKLDVCLNKNVIGMFEQKGKSNKLEDINPSLLLSPFCLFGPAYNANVLGLAFNASNDGMLWYGMAWHGSVWHGSVWFGVSVFRPGHTASVFRPHCTRPPTLLSWMLLPSRLLLPHCTTWPHELPASHQQPTNRSKHQTKVKRNK